MISKIPIDTDKKIDGKSVRLKNPSVAVSLSRIRKLTNL